jgi:hypothetical protein
MLFPLLEKVNQLEYFENIFSSCFYLVGGINLKNGLCSHLDILVRNWISLLILTIAFLKFEKKM